VVHDRVGVTEAPKAPPIYKRRRPLRLHHEPAAVTWAREKCGLTKRALAREVGISEQLMCEFSKIQAKLHEITRQRERLSTRLQGTDQDLSTAIQAIELCLELLQDPQALYLRCDDQRRRMLNQALFHGLYIDEEVSAGTTIAGSLKEPFAALHHVQQQRRAPKDLTEGQGTPGGPQAPPGATSPPQRKNSALPPGGEGHCLGPSPGRPTRRPLEGQGFQ
jgi:hypothetical protein